MVGASGTRFHPDKALEVEVAEEIFTLNAIPLGGKGFSLLRRQGGGF